MKAYIMNGNTRVKSNTEALAEILAGELAVQGFEVIQVSLRSKNLKTCIGCDKCHQELESFGCILDDDMKEVADKILSSDLIVFSSPIYTWMPAPPLKIVMDRIYAFTKYPRNDSIFNLMKKQKFAVLTTAGGPLESNCDIFSEIVKRMAQFAFIPYIGHVAAQDFEDASNPSARDNWDPNNITRPEVIDSIRAFAEKCRAAFN
jgi:multimeric flavodoxin WrbA